MRKLRVVSIVMLLSLLVACNQSNNLNKHKVNQEVYIIQSNAHELILALEKDGIELQWERSELLRVEGGTRVNVPTNDVGVVLTGFVEDNGTLAALFVRAKLSQNLVLVGDYISGLVKGYHVEADSFPIYSSTLKPKVEEVSYVPQTTPVMNTLATIQQRSKGQPNCEFENYSVGIYSPETTCWELRRDLQNARQARDRAYRNYLLAVAATAAAIAAEAAACVVPLSPQCAAAVAVASAALAHQAAARADWLAAKDYYDRLLRAYNLSTCA
ncbi:hypothetical protein [Oceanithermus sp.]